MSRHGSYLARVGIVFVCCAVGTAKSAPEGDRCAADRGQTFFVSEGTVELLFDERGLTELELAFASQGDLESDGRGTFFVLEVQPWSPLEFRMIRDRFGGLTGGSVSTCGALLLDRPGERMVIGNLLIEAGADGVIRVVNELHGGKSPVDPVFEMTSVMMQFNRVDRRFEMVGELSVTDSWARKLGKPESAGLIVGQARIDVQVFLSKRALAVDSAATDDLWQTADDGEGFVATVEGPDVIVADLQSTIRYAAVGDIIPYGIGTTACNLGTERADWVASTNQHPVIIQNLYRLKDDRFEQVGMSWIKHGFYAVSQSVCQPCYDRTDGSQLGVGCSDPYSASLNAVQTNMSPRSTVNAHTGYFGYPWGGPAPTTSIERRLQVHTVDLYPQANPGARYFIEGHYVHPGDAAAGTHDNNASYREITVNGDYDLVINPSWSTQREQPAARAWQDADPEVVETDVRVPGEGLFVLAGKAIDLGGGDWRYSYVLQNLDSDRSARSFSVEIPDGAVVTNVGFHDVEYHSGEVYDPALWQTTVTDQFVTWSTSTYEQDPNANALRYSSAYSFYFDVNASPDVDTITIGLFKPGDPSEVSATTIMPKKGFIDCNGNDVSDLCDLDCLASGCGTPCGGSADCNDNGIPDECDVAHCPPDDSSCVDCNTNGVPDICELDGHDCNANQVPDDCELAEDDCNANEIPDECDLTLCQGEPACSDCNANSALDECDIASGEPDVDGDGMPDSCQAPLALLVDPTGMTKSRFISFVVATPLPGGQYESALRVRLVSLHHVVPPYTGGATIPFTAFEGQVRWVGPPELCIESASSGTPFFASKLACVPYYQDWTTVGLLHVSDSAIVPSSVYDVENVSVVCLGHEPSCEAVSAPLRIETTRWGDVEEPLNPPSATTQPDFGDIGSLVNKFKSALGAPIKARALLAGIDEYGIINPHPDLGFTHISACVDAFKGIPYPYTMAACP